MDRRKLSAVGVLSEARSIGGGLGGRLSMGGPGWSPTGALRRDSAWLTEWEGMVGRGRTRRYPGLALATLVVGATSIGGGASCTRGQGDDSAAGAVEEFSAPRASLVERLGHPADAKLLIVHTDDIGLAHSANRATVDAFATGLVNSGSVMVPSPWFPEIAAYARDNPDADLGLHLTLTSEWEYLCWGPVLSRDAVPSLVDSLGFLPSTSREAARSMDPREAEAEMRAQVERALVFGMQPTHLDSHMGAVFRTAELFEAYLRVGRAFELPVLVPSYRELGPEFTNLLTADDLTIDYAVIASPEVPAERWAEFYTNVIRSLKPGVTQVVIHLAYDDDEMRGVTVDRASFDAGWRQRDFDFFTGDHFRQLLQESGVQLITWREIRSLLRP